MAQNENEGSFLPDWLLDLKQNITNSKKIYSQTSKRIEGLKFRVEALGERIDEVQPRKPHHHVKNTRTILIHQLPIDTVIIIVRFLDVKSLVIFENVSKLVRSLLNTSELWVCYFKDLYPDIDIPNSNICKPFIMQQAQFGVTGLKFIKLINSNRTLTRGRSFELTHLSKIESMTKDFRSFALLSLRSLYSITCHENSPIFQSLLVEGIIRVLISLLSNESSLIQQYSCDIIANMLSWESLVLRKCDSALGHQAVSTELQVCDGRRQLLSLLTSPSAAVVLSQRIQHDHPYRTENSFGNGKVTKSTASVQGVANKSASRALVNYFCTEYPILSPHREDLLIVGDHDYLSFKKSSSVQTPLSFLQNATPWRFMYYHRSGFLKDIHEIWINFSNGGMSLQGRGVDDFGPFIMKGEAEVGFGDLTWYLDKYHLQANSLELDAESLSIWLQNKDRIWLSDDEFWAIGKKSVTNVGYTSTQIPLMKKIDTPCSTGILEREEGLWGVWENASIGSHYELQKGGVFRAIALA